LYIKQVTNTIGTPCCTGYFFFFVLMSNEFPDHTVNHMKRESQEIGRFTGQQLDDDTGGDVHVGDVG